MGDGLVGRRVAPDAVLVSNEQGASPYVILCDHASNHVPAEFGSLGLAPEDLLRHIAWDPGALPVSAALARILDATLVESRVSRLVIDCNRPLDAPDLIAEISETTAIPGNRSLSEADRGRRIALSYEPYHAAIENLVEARLAAGRETCLVAVHSYNPIYRGVARPWHVGIIHDDDKRLASPLIATLADRKDVVVGVNQPYSPADRVYFTLEKHGRSRGLPCVMIEIRNDEIAEEEPQIFWARLIAASLAELSPSGDGAIAQPAGAVDA